MNLQQQYRSRAAEFGQQAQQLQTKYNTFSLVRLLLFVIGVGVFIFLLSMGWLWVSGFTMIFIFSFARFVRWHLALQREQKRLENLAQINHNEEQALDHQYSCFAAGEEWIDPLHPYSFDMDIYGEHSFFQFCNRTSTAIGRGCLADYLSAPASSEVIRERQAAVTELKDKLDWRQNLQAHGMDAKDDIQHVQALKRWLKMPPFVMGRPGLLAAIYLNPLWAIAGFLLVVYAYIPWQAGLLFLLPPILILRQFLERTNDTHNLTAQADDILAVYGQLIGQIENHSFDSPLLQKLKSAYSDDKIKASVGISRLSYIISQLNVRYNAFAIIFNIIGLWDLHWILRLEKWKATYQDHLPEWFASLQEFEALSSLGTLAYNHTDWCLPEISNQSLLHAKELGHPLIHARDRITNDIDIPTEGHIKLVTGSNMAGKSTFLRTIGLNIILAMAGAPVCAKRFSLPLLEVHSSMRTQDALHESTSSFYAELKRLKTIIEAVESQPNIFFLLDEILKGTNSKDRHTGSKALIQQFIRSKGAGIIATHDLELGGLEAQAEGAIENLCMEVEIQNGKLDFDYKLKKGVSKSFNATLLMKNMGIRI